MNVSDQLLAELLKTMLIKDIARAYGIRSANLAYRCRRLGIKSSSKMGEWNKVYSLEQRQKVIRVYKTNTASETAKLVGLTKGQVIGLMETSRRMGIIGNAFKDKRNKAPWTFKERLSLIRMAGLVNRSEIGKRLGRDGQRNIKERMRNDFNSGTKFLHGMPITWVRELIPMDLEDRKVQTTAGPRGVINGAVRTCFRIVPWTDLEQVTFAIRLDPSLKSAIRAMARFQRFIWQCDDNEKIRGHILGVIRNER